MASQLLNHVLPPLISALNHCILGYVKPQESEQSPDVILISSVLWLWICGCWEPMGQFAVVFGAGEKQFGGWVGVNSLCDQKMGCFLNSTLSLGMKGEGRL